MNQVDVKFQHWTCRQLIVAVITIVLVVSCSDTRPDAQSVQSGDASAALQAAQIALDQAGGYRLSVDQSNFVLAQWGGSDGGTVIVNGDGTAAEAKLRRTGEPGATYALTLVDGQTFFQRSTCTEAFRIPGGGGDVLRTYLFSQTRAFANAKDAYFEGGLIRATLDGLGSVTIKLNSKTLLPEELRGEANGHALIWKFEAWKTKPNASAPKGTVQDRGPGGVPC